jgi:predicted O-methyltransferase YrrM
MDEAQRERARSARGFMPAHEGDALYEAASMLAVDGPLLEVGSYCGKSAVYLGTAAREQGRLLFAVDHHRGSEENQVGWEHHAADLVDPELGKLDTLPTFRRTIHEADLEATVVALVGDSPSVAEVWHTPLAFLFIDGGHGSEPAHRDYDGWLPSLSIGGSLAIHDVFPDPLDGGRPPYEIYCRAIDSGAFEQVGSEGSLRVLRRVQRGH